MPPFILNQNNVAYSVRATPERMAEVEGVARNVRASIRPNRQWTAALEALQNRLTKPVFRTQPRDYAGPYGGSRSGGTTSGAYGSGLGVGEGISSDRAQQRRIDGINEQERCADGRVVSIHVGC